MLCDEITILSKMVWFKHPVVKIIDWFSVYCLQSFEPIATLPEHCMNQTQHNPNKEAPC